MIHVVVGVLSRASGVVFITQRGDTKEYAGCYEFPGGKVECGSDPLEPIEDEVEALEREWEEELGLDVVAEHFDYCWDDPREPPTIYRGDGFTLTALRIAHVRKMCPSPLDGQKALCWLTLSELEELPTTPSTPHIIAELRRVWPERFGAK